MTKDQTERLKNINRDIEFYEKALIPSERKYHPMKENDIRERIKKLEEEKNKLEMNN